MQLITLTLDHGNFYSPTTGVWISHGEINEQEESLLGYWMDKFWRNPFIKDNRLNEYWQGYLKTTDYKMDSTSAFLSPISTKSLENFFRSSEIENAVVFKITDSLSQIPVTYFIVDFNITN